MGGLVGALAGAVEVLAIPGTLPICGVPCTTGTPGGEIRPLPSSTSPPRVVPYRGDQGGTLFLRSSSFSAADSDVADACTLSCVLPHFPQKLVFSGRSAPQVLHFCIAYYPF